MCFFFISLPSAVVGQHGSLHPGDSAQEVTQTLHKNTGSNRIQGSAMTNECLYTDKGCGLGENH